MLEREVCAVWSGFDPLSHFYTDFLALDHHLHRAQGARSQIRLWAISMPAYSPASLVRSRPPTAARQSGCSIADSSQRWWRGAWGLGLASTKAYCDYGHGYGYGYLNNFMIASGCPPPQKHL